MAEPADAPAHMWFVKIGGEVWGPYPQDRIAVFAREGRVRAATLVSPFAQGPWAPAAETAEFASGLAAAPPAPRASTAIPTHEAPPVSRATGPAVRLETRPKSQPAPVRPSASPAVAERALLVFAELSTVAPAAFQAALGRLGRCSAVRPGLWLLRASLTAASLRNLLSSGLGGADTLLVVETPLEQAAWFNLAPAQDRELRRLWAGG